MNNQERLGRLYAAAGGEEPNDPDTAEILELAITQLQDDWKQINRYREQLDSALAVTSRLQAEREGLIHRVVGAILGVRDSENPEQKNVLDDANRFVAETPAEDVTAETIAAVINSGDHGWKATVVPAPVPEEAFTASKINEWLETIITAAARRCGYTDEVNMLPWDWLERRAKQPFEEIEAVCASYEEGVRLAVARYLDGRGVSEVSAIDITISVEDTLRGIRGGWLLTMSSGGPERK